MSWASSQIVRVLREDGGYSGDVGGHCIEIDYNTKYGDYEISIDGCEIMRASSEHELEEIIDANT